MLKDKLSFLATKIGYRRPLRRHLARQTVEVAQTLTSDRLHLGTFVCGQNTILTLSPIVLCLFISTVTLFLFRISKHKLCGCKSGLSPGTPWSLSLGKRSGNFFCKIICNSSNYSLNLGPVPCSCCKFLSWRLLWLYIKVEGENRSDF